MNAGTFGKPSVEAIKRERDRLATFDNLNPLKSSRDEGFDRIVRPIQRVFTVEIDLVSLIDDHRQWHHACSGLSAEEVSGAYLLSLCARRRAADGGAGRNEGSAIRRAPGWHRS